jgi:hypothetical protein
MAVRRYARSGYGWLWSGPTGGDDYATPDLPLIGIRLLCATAIGAAGIVVSGYKLPKRN